MKTTELAAAETKCLTLKKEINENHRLAQRAAGEAVARGVLTGELLLQWKDLLPHGQFESFVETHFDGSLRTARVYMQAAKQMNSLSNRQRTAVLENEKSISGLLRSDDQEDRNDTPLLESSEQAENAYLNENSQVNAIPKRQSSAVLDSADSEEAGLKLFPGEDGRTDSDGTEAQEQAPETPRNGTEGTEAPGEELAKLRAKTVKTVEAMMRCFDDLQEAKQKTETHEFAVTSFKWLLNAAREWK